MAKYLEKAKDVKAMVNGLVTDNPQLLTTTQLPYAFSETIKASPRPWQGTVRYNYLQAVFGDFYEVKQESYQYEDYRTKVKKTGQKVVFFVKN